MFICVSLFSAIYLWAKQSPKVADKHEKKETLKMIEKTEEEWREQLTAEQYRILRKAGTERPNGNIYNELISNYNVGIVTTVIRKFFY